MRIIGRTPGLRRHGPRAAGAGTDADVGRHHAALGRPTPRRADTPPREFELTFDRLSCDEGVSRGTRGHGGHPPARRGGGGSKSVHRDPVEVLNIQWVIQDFWWRIRVVYAAPGSSTGPAMNRSHLDPPPIHGRHHEESHQAHQPREVDRMRDQPPIRRRHQPGHQRDHRRRQGPGGRRAPAHTAGRTWSSARSACRRSTGSGRSAAPSGSRSPSAPAGRSPRSGPAPSPGTAAARGPGSRSGAKNRLTMSLETSVALPSSSAEAVLTSAAHSPARMMPRRQRRQVQHDPGQRLGRHDARVQHRGRHADQRADEAHRRDEQAAAAGSRAPPRARPAPQSRSGSPTGCEWHRGDHDDEPGGDQARAHGPEVEAGVSRPAAAPPALASRPAGRRSAPRPGRSRRRSRAR